MEEVSPSILQRIVKDSLRAFPAQAHLKVLAFFESKKISEQSANLLKAAWSKAVLSHDAFGRGKKTSVDSEIFFHDFVDELMRNFSDGDALHKLSDRIVAAQNDLMNLDIREIITEHQQKSMEGIIGTLDASDDLIRKYVRALYSMPPSFLTVTEDHENRNLDAMVQYQEVMRKMKAVWQRTESSRPHVHPINEALLFERKYRIGKLAVGLDDVVDPPIFCSSTEAVGVDLPHDHSSASDVAWSTFGFLHDFVCCRYFNLFPKPITVVRHEETFGTIFLFESPSCRALNDFLGAELAVQLRKHPAMVAVWCTQLALAAQAMSMTLAQSTSQSSLEKDVLLRDDGMLLIGGVSFSEAEAICGDDNLQQFTPTIYQILSTALCTSRTERMVLPVVTSFQNGGAVFARRDASQAPSGHGSEKEKGQGPREFVLAAYSHLSVKLVCGALADSLVLPADQVYPPTGLSPPERWADLEHYYSVLVVAMSWSAETSSSRSREVSSTPLSEPVVKAKIVKDAHAAAGVYAMLEIFCASPGQLVIECSALIPNAFNMSAAERRLGNIIVNVMDMPPAESVEVQEVIGFIEERHIWGIDTAIFNSFLFQNARDLMYDEKESKEVMVQCAGDWSTVRRMLLNGAVKI